MADDPTTDVSFGELKRGEEMFQTLRRELGDMVVAALHRHPLYHAAALPLRTLSPRFKKASSTAFPKSLCPMTATRIPPPFYKPRTKDILYISYSSGDDTRSFCALNRC